MMTTRIRILAILGVAAAAPAHADSTDRHGSQCAPKHSSRDLVGADERGMYNASTTATANVTCAAPERTFRWDGSITPSGAAGGGREPVTAITVYGRDLSATVPFSCYLFTTDANGFSSWAPTKYMCSQPNGCTDSTTSFTGLSLINWWIGETSLNAEADMFGVVCNIPPATSAGASYVKATKASDLAATY